MRTLTNIHTNGDKNGENYTYTQAQKLPKGEGVHCSNLYLAFICLHSYLPLPPSTLAAEGQQEEAKHQRNT